MATRGIVVLSLAAVAACAAGGRQPVLAQANAPGAPAPATTQDGEKFDAFLRGFRDTAIAAGVAGDVYDRATTGLKPNARIKALNENQPETSRPIWDYLASAVSDLRVTRGREMLRANDGLFDRIEAAYGVPREIIAAIWGIESNYGQNTGSYNVFESLATLAYDGPRQAYGRDQLIAALKLSESEKIDPKMLIGSWAGAIGHTQFIPTTYASYAVDGDGDGKRDLRGSADDALASTENYLKVSGWHAGEIWGEEVRLPANFAYELADQETFKTLDEWAALGVTDARGNAISGSTKAAMFLPAGYRGPAVLCAENFSVILKYNTATVYALAVGILSDRLKERDGIVAAWPKDEVPLDMAARTALQDNLGKLGFSAGNADGVIGRRTRAALREYQKAHALPADGFATQALAQRIAAEAAGPR